MKGHETGTSISWQMHFRTFSHLLVSIIMVCDSVRPSVTTSPAAAKGPTDLIFGMYMEIGDRMTIFGKSRSKVKGQGQISTKNRFLQSLMSTLDLQLEMSSKNHCASRDAQASLSMYITYNSVSIQTPRVFQPKSVDFNSRHKPSQAFPEKHVSYPCLTATPFIAPLKGFCILKAKIGISVTHTP